jgi:hypothetical protein
LETERFGARFGLLIEVGQGGDANSWVKNQDVQLLQLVATQQEHGQITQFDTLNPSQMALEWD